MAKNGTKNGQKRVEAEQSSYFREYPVAFGQKREIVGVDQSDTANNTLCRYCFQSTSVFSQKAPGAPVFGHCPISNTIITIITTITTITIAIVITITTTIFFKKNINASRPSVITTNTNNIKSQERASGACKLGFYSAAS